MNKKATKFQEMLTEKKIDAFQTEELKDKFDTTVFRSHLEVKGQYLPLMVLLDDSLYSIVRVIIASKAIDEKSRPHVLEHIDHLNRGFKVFKYFTTDDGSLVLDACVPSAEDAFDPEAMRIVIDVVLEHLQNSYKETMEAIWSEGSKAKNAENEAEEVTESKGDAQLESSAKDTKKAKTPAKA